MNKYIENDYMRGIAKIKLRDKLLIANAKEIENGIIVKAGWLKKFEYIKTDRKDYVPFTFLDMAKISHTACVHIKEGQNINQVPIPIGYEIIYDTKNDEFSINIHAYCQKIKTNSIKIPEELFLESRPDKEIINFMETKLNIIENNIELLNNEKINNLLK